ncbi:ester cyclase [Fredinandcohnia humi]
MKILTDIPFFAVPTTGKTVRFSLIILLRIVDDKIIEKRAHVDLHAILRQLGVTS